MIFKKCGEIQQKMKPKNIAPVVALEIQVIISKKSRSIVTSSTNSFSAKASVCEVRDGGEESFHKSQCFKIFFTISETENLFSFLNVCPRVHPSDADR